MFFARILRGAGFEVNVLFGAENPGVEAWKRIPQAQFNLVVSPWVGIKNAEHLQKKYNQPYLHIPEIPVGEEATAKFIRQVVEYAGIDKAQSEQFIRQEADIYYYYLEHFSEFFAEYWYGMPSEFVVTADAAYKKGALFFEVATPSSETLVINRSHIGYRGALQFLERIYSASVGGR
ncbi:nitrogenase component 1 [Segatella baroniae]|uniref:nitrogenase component 1 n=1 Tax=Segatella baroniae TaxID=305719 RepID=UPI00040971C4|nr:nitrogenase component 1 [Segatella baroniae]